MRWIRAFREPSTFHVKQLVGMLDLRVRPGEYEALAPCLLEETIMRGRRRGRNRPSPQGPSSDVSASSSGSVEQGSVKLAEVEDSVGSEQESSAAGTPRKIEEPSEASPADSPTDSSKVEAAISPTDSPAPTSEVSDAASNSVPTEPESVKETVEVEATVDAPESTPVESVDGTDPLAVTDSPRPDEVAVEESIADQLVRATAKKNAGSGTAPTVRQAQAASGNPLPRVLAVANQKGGVGKTTTSVNLGAALAELGFRVLVIDLDPQGNATTGLGIDARNFELSMYDVLMRDCSLEDCVEPTSMKNLFVAPATIALAGAEIELVPAFSRELKLKRAIESVIDDFDYVLIDCPPSLGLITVNALAAASEVLVPIQCEYYALEGLSQLMRNVHLVASNLNPRLDISTIVLTMYDARTKLSDQVATEVREHFGNKVCRIVIPRTVRLSEAPSFGQPITAFDPASRGAIAYRELAKEVSGGTS